MHEAIDIGSSVRRIHSIAVIAHILGMIQTELTEYTVSLKQIFRMLVITLL